jgi:peptidoglycan hydrolase CwlO-like protein
MAPDVEELIKRVNTLTLDKNRLKQKLNQLINDQNGKEAILRLNQLSLRTQHNSLGSLDSSADENNGQSLNSTSSIQKEPNTTEGSNKQKTTGVQNSSNQTTPGNGYPLQSSTNRKVIAGVECATSCEEDILYVNDLLRKRVDEYNDNWTYIQSKCSAILSELTALQVHYGRLKSEKLELDEKYKKKCEECDDIKNELQTVVLNYETQLSAMSEHLSALTSRQIS